MGLTGEQHVNELSATNIEQVINFVTQWMNSDTTANELSIRRRRVTIDVNIIEALTIDVNTVVAIGITPLAIA